MTMPLMMTIPLIMMMVMPLMMMMVGHLRRILLVPCRGGAGGGFVLDEPDNIFLDKIQIFKPDTLANICFGTKYMLANICVI